jgi:hypothetical protein
MACNLNGCRNVAIGSCAGYLMSGSSCSVVIGNSALYNNSNGSHSVAIGNCAGYNETGSNKLHIANSASCSLIYGEFDNKLVRVDCVLQVCKDLQSLTNGGGVILCSPDGTKYCITVANGGTLSVTAV